MKTSKKLERHRSLRIESLESREMLSLSVPSFSSFPEANHTIYLDFDGHETKNTSWNNYTHEYTVNKKTYKETTAKTFTTRAYNGTQTDRDNITKIVAEYFSPFFVSVTQVDPGINRLAKTSTDDTDYGVRVVIGGDNGDWLQTKASASTAGIAEIGSFARTTRYKDKQYWDTPCYVFSEDIVRILGKADSIASIAKTITHEVGHTLGLTHHGQIGDTDEYYDGHPIPGADRNWVPFMGGGSSTGLYQWSKAEYSNPTNPNQDDLEIITTRNGFGYRMDEKVNDHIFPRELVLKEGNLSVKGTIDSYDTDYFTLYVSERSTVNFNISAGVQVGSQQYSSLYFGITSYSLWGDTIKPCDAKSLKLSFSETLEPGEYDIMISGAEGNGFSEYGSIGTYTINATVTKAPPRGNETASTVVTTLDDVVNLSDGKVSLREAIAYAGTGGLGSTVTFAAALQNKTIKLTQGELKLYDKNITIDGRGRNITIDADKKDRVFVIEGSENFAFAVTLAGLTLTGGNASNESGGAIFFSYNSNRNSSLTLNKMTLTENQAGSYGGAVFCPSSNLTILNSVIKNNQSGFEGGGIFFSGGPYQNFVMKNSTVLNNSSGAGGGGVRLRGNHDAHFDGESDAVAVIENCTISNNDAQGIGGGLLATQYIDVTIRNSTIVDNTAYGQGGGIFYRDGDLSITDSTVQGNTVNFLLNDDTNGAWGGGVYLEKSKLMLQRSFICGNAVKGSSAYGGGIFINGDDGLVSGYCLEARNTVIAGNSADSHGGGIYIFMSSGSASSKIPRADIANCTIVGNRVGYGYGGGIGNYNGVLDLRGTVVAQNTGGTGYTDIWIDERYSASGTTHYSLVGNSSTQRAFASTSNMYYGDPQFVKFTPYTTWTKDLWKSWNLMPTVGSRLVNHGYQVFSALGNYDVAGNTRNYGGTIDIGAYEYDSVSTVGTPTNFKAVQNGKNVVLTWSAASNAATYRIGRWNDVMKKWVDLSKACTKLTLTNNNVTPGTHKYLLRAYNGTAYGNSVTVSINVKRTIAVGTPANFKAVQNGKNVVLTWSAASNATTYRIGRWNDVTKKWVDLSKACTKLTLTNNNVTPGTHKYLLRAYNGTSYGNSVTVSINVKGTTTVGTPTNFKAVQNGKNVVLTWSAASNATTYRIGRWNDVTGKWVDLSKACTKLTLTNNNVTPGTHKYLLRAYNGTAYGNSVTVSINVKRTAAAGTAALSPLEAVFAEYGTEYEI